MEPRDHARPFETIDYAYNAASELTSVSDAFSSYTYIYDDAGRLKTVDVSGTGVPPVVLTSTLDGLGRRTGLDATINGTADFQNTYVYDADGRMTRIEQTGTGITGKRVDFGYDRLGR
ncbi:MAG: hypothetical protein ACREQV_06065, partial [Candidatus Binatia bacterium]